MAQRRDSYSHDRSIPGETDDQTRDLRVHDGLYTKADTADVSRAVAHGWGGNRLSRHAWVLARAVPRGETLWFLATHVFATSGWKSDRARGNNRVGDGSREFLERHR